jgi:Fic family protein
MYIYQHKDWPDFTWDNTALLTQLGRVRHLQGKLTGKMEALGFKLKKEATLNTLTLDVLKTSEIEGESLDHDQVRSSVARHLRMDISGLIKSDRNVDGVVEMMLDATQNFTAAINEKRLFDWHRSLFPANRSRLTKMIIGNWRNGAKGPMQVVSGSIGREKIHYQAPHALTLKKEIKLFLKWFNETQELDPVLKAGIAHLWFVTLHPFEDGNGRIARAIADLQLCRADENSQRFYSVSAQIRLVRNKYYAILERTQKGSLNITEWLKWFLECLENALKATTKILEGVLTKAKFWEKHTATKLNDRQRKMINKLFDAKPDDSQGRGFIGKLSSSKWAKIAKCSPDTALRDIQDLIDKNILVKEKAGGRSTNYELKALR